MRTASARCAAGQRGVTLADLVLSLSLGAVIVYMIGMVLVGSQGLSKDIEATTRGTATCDRIVSAMSEELTSGVRLASSEGTALVSATSLAYQEPVDGDGDGDFYDATGEVQWGADGRLGWFREYLWIDSGVRSESDEGVDLNGDGDGEDIFRKGDLVHRTVDAAGTEVDRRVITGQGPLIQSISGQNDIPPLFFLTAARTVEVTLTMPVVTEVKSRRTSQVFTSRRVVTFRGI